MRKAWLTMGLVCAMTAGLSLTAHAGAWQQDGRGWWYLNDDGTYLQNTCRWIDGNWDGIGELYYFDAQGYLITSQRVGWNYVANANGAATYNGMVLTDRMPYAYYTSDIMGCHLIIDGDYCDNLLGIFGPEVGGHFKSLVNRGDYYEAHGWFETSHRGTSGEDLPQLFDTTIRISKNCIVHWNNDTDIFFAEYANELGEYGRMYAPITTDSRGYVTSFSDGNWE